MAINKAAQVGDRVKYKGKEYKVSKDKGSYLELQGAQSSDRVEAYAPDVVVISAYKNQSFQNGRIKALADIERLQNGLVFNPNKFEEGQRARREGKAMEDNPYPGNESHAKSWLLGWNNPSRSYTSLGVM